MRPKRIALTLALLAMFTTMVRAEQLDRIRSLIAIEDYGNAIKALEQIVSTEKAFDGNARYLLAKCYYLSPREVSELRPKTFTVGKERVTGVESVTVNVNRQKAKEQLRIVANLKGGLKKLLSALDDDAPETFKKEVIAAIAAKGDRSIAPGLTKHLANPSLKTSILTALGKLKDKRSLKRLTDALSDEDYRVRLAAIEALSELKDPRSVDPLINALAGASPEEKMNIVHALGEIGDPKAVPAIIAQEKYLGFTNADLHALAQLATDEAVRHLLRHPRYYSCLPHERDSRHHNVIRRIGAKKMAAYLVDLLKNGDVEQRRGASSWLSGHARELLPHLKEDDLIRSLDDPDSAVRGNTAKLLAAKRTEKARKALLEMAMSSRDKLSFLNAMDQKTATKIATELLRRGNSDIRYYAATWLSERGASEGEKALIAAILDPNRRVRSTAIAYVRRRRIKAAVPLLAETLRGEDTETKRLAVNALSAIGDESVVDSLISVLKTTKGADSRTRETAAEYLARAKQERVFDVFVAALNDPDETVRSYCIAALGAFKDRKAIGPLVGAVTKATPNESERIGNALRKIDRRKAAKSLVALIAKPKKASPTVVGNAARALAAVGDNSAVEPLKRLLPLFERKTYARRSIVDALWRLEGKSYESERAADHIERKRAAGTANPRQLQSGVLLRKMTKVDSRKGSFEEIRKDLESKDAFTREGAIYALAEVKDPNAKEAQALIIKYLKNDRDSDVRIAAATVLGEERIKRGVPALIEGLEKDKDEEVREAAAEALGNIGDPRAIAPLISALGDQDAWTQDAAEDALIWISDDHQDAVVGALKKSINHAKKVVRARVRDLLKEIANVKFEEKEK